MATIKEVARLAGVSASTVSRALSNKVRVDDATRKKVLAAVNTLGYRPNLMARSLKEGFSRTLAIVLPDITNPFFPKLVQCTEQAATAKGYSLLLCDSGNDEAQELRHLEYLTSHYVDGVLYLAVVDGVERVEMLRREGVPVVMINRDFNAGVPCVTNDNYHGAHTVIDYLVRCGHRKIACLVAPTSMQHYRQRYEGCLKAFADHGIEDYKRFLVWNVTGVEDAYLHTKRLLAMPDPPTAFFAFVDIMTIGVYSGIHESGLSVPQEVSVAGFDNISIAQHMIPPLTTYEHPVARIAAKAVDELIGCITGGTSGYRSFEMPGSLIVRKSVASPAAVV